MTAPTRNLSRALIFVAAALLATATVPAVAGAATTKVLNAPAHLPNAFLYEVSCASAGNCVAIGGADRPTATPHGSAALYQETRGVWGRPHLIGGKLLHGKGSVSVAGISCPRRGYCSLVGTYSATYTAPSHVFAMTEKAGVWGPPRSGPKPPAAKPAAIFSEADSLACAAVHVCTVAYSTGVTAVASSLYVVRFDQGKWGTSQRIAPPRLTGDETLGDEFVACPAITRCTIVASYGNGVLASAFVSSQVASRWSPARSLTGYSLNTWVVGTTALSCVRPGSCVAMAFRSPRHSNKSEELPVEISQIAGRWQAPRALESSSPKIDSVIASSISCTGVDTCTAVGRELDTASAPSHYADYSVVFKEDKGRWSRAQVLGTGTRKIKDTPEALSCVATTCVAVGTYDAKYNKPLVITAHNGNWSY